MKKGEKLEDEHIYDVNGNEDYHHNIEIEKNIFSTTITTSSTTSTITILDGSGSNNKSHRSSLTEYSDSDTDDELVDLSMALNLTKKQKEKESDDDQIVAMAIERLRGNDVNVTCYYCAYYPIDDDTTGTPGSDKQCDCQKQQENNSLELELKDKDKSSVYNNVITTGATTNTNGYSMFNGHHIETKHQLLEVPSTPSVVSCLDTKLLHTENDSLIISTNEIGSKIVNGLKKSIKRKRRRKRKFLLTMKKKRKTTLPKNLGQSQPPIVLPTNVHVDKDLVIKKMTLDDINGISTDFKPAKICKIYNSNNSDLWEVTLSPPVNSLDDTITSPSLQNIDIDHQNKTSKDDTGLVKDNKGDVDYIKVMYSFKKKREFSPDIINFKKVGQIQLELANNNNNKGNNSSTTTTTATTTIPSKKKYNKKRCGQSSSLDLHSKLKNVEKIIEMVATSTATLTLTNQVQPHNYNSNKDKVVSTFDFDNHDVPGKIDDLIVPLPIASPLEKVEVIEAKKVKRILFSEEKVKHFEEKGDKSKSSIIVQEKDQVESKKVHITELQKYVAKTVEPILVPISIPPSPSVNDTSSTSTNPQAKKVKRKLFPQEKGDKSKSPIFAAQEVENEKVHITELQKDSTKTVEPILVPISIPSSSVNDTCSNSTHVYPRLKDSLPEVTSDSMQLRRSSFYSLISRNVRTNMANYLDGRPLNFTLPKRRKHFVKTKIGYRLFHGDNFPEDPESPYRLHLATQLLIKFNKRPVQTQALQVKPKPKEQNYNKSFNHSYFKLVAVKRSARAGKNELCNRLTVPTEDQEPLFSGVWTRPKKFICHLCGQVEKTIWDMVSHKSVEHPGVFVTHMDLDLNLVPCHGLIRPLPKNNDLSSKIPPCSKCSATFDKLDELHRHIFECAGNLAWLEEKSSEQTADSRLENTLMVNGNPHSLPISIPLDNLPLSKYLRYLK